MSLFTSAATCALGLRESFQVLSWPVAAAFDRVLRGMGDVVGEKEGSTAPPVTWATERDVLLLPHAGRGLGFDGVDQGATHDGLLGLTHADGLHDEEALVGGSSAP